jgi:hypothetical protein
MEQAWGVDSDIWTRASGQTSGRLSFYFLSTINIFSVH